MRSREERMRILWSQDTMRKKKNFWISGCWLERSPFPVYRCTEVLSYFNLKDPAGGRQRRMSFQLGTGSGCEGWPNLSTTECRNPRTNMAVTSFNSTLASRVPRQMVLPVGELITVQDQQNVVQGMTMSRKKKRRKKKDSPPPQPT